MKSEHSTRERVVALLRKGLCNKEIAEQTGISLRAVKWQVEQLYKEYGLLGPSCVRKLIVILLHTK